MQVGFEEVRTVEFHHVGCLSPKNCDGTHSFSHKCPRRNPTVDHRVGRTIRFMNRVSCYMTPKRKLGIPARPVLLCQNRVILTRR